MKNKYTPETYQRLKELEFWQEEVEKCKNPYYFWKNYINYKGKPNLTEEQFNQQILDRQKVGNTKFTIH